MCITWLAAVLLQSSTVASTDYTVCTGGAALCAQQQLKGMWTAGVGLRNWWCRISCTICFGVLVCGVVACWKQQHVSCCVGC